MQVVTLRNVPNVPVERHWHGVRAATTMGLVGGETTWG